MCVDVDARHSRAPHLELLCSNPHCPFSSSACNVDDAHLSSLPCVAWRHLQVLPPYEVVTIQAGSDDLAAIYIGGTAVHYSACCGALTSAAPVTLRAGFHKVVFVFFQLGGAPTFTFEMGFNGSGYGAIAPWRVSPVPLGAAVPVALTVNGLAVPAACEAATLNATVPSGTVFTSATAAQPTSASVPAGTCGFMFSSVHSPSNTSVQVRAALGRRMRVGSGPCCS